MMLEFGTMRRKTEIDLSEIPSKKADFFRVQKFCTIRHNRTQYTMHPLLFIEGVNMKFLDDIEINSENHLVGNEAFTYNGQETDMTILEYWRWHYSEIFDLQDTIAEFIVAKALGMKEAYNVGSWTLYDIEYQGKRIEVKETSYMHAWQTDDEPKSKSRVFGITKVQFTRDYTG